MESMISGLLDEKVNEIFFEIQKEFNITDGNIYPEEYYVLCEKQHELTILIGSIIRREMYNK